MEIVGNIFAANGIFHDFPLQCVIFLEGIDSRLMMMSREGYCTIDLGLNMSFKS